MPYRNKDLLPYGLLVLVFATTALFRPLLPVDETRYLTVAWEMYLRHDLIKLSVNFEPYNHKPPLLFWLINLTWHIFGVSREAALLPIFFASAAVIALTQKLSNVICDDEAVRITPYIVLGSFPFLAYSSMMMFDMMIAAFTLAYHILMFKYTRAPKALWPILAGIMLGFAFLTKGPVALLYVIGPVLAYPWWRKEGQINPKTFYRGFAVSIFVSLVPLLLWLTPLALESDKDFLWTLVWKQSAGRITGHVNNAHARPFYFYLMLLPLIAIPWVFFPSFWKSLKTIKVRNEKSILIISTILPALCVFSMISGKQFHYLLPLFPYIAIALTSILSRHKKLIPYTALGMVGLFIIAHVIASYTVFPHYDLRPYAAYYREHANEDWAFVRNYQGEIGFLGQVEKPIANLHQNELQDWMKAHPNGKAIVRYSRDDSFMGEAYPVYTSPYRGKMLGIFQSQKE